MKDGRQAHAIGIALRHCAIASNGGKAQRHQVHHAYHRGQGGAQAVCHVQLVAGLIQAQAKGPRQGSIHSAHAVHARQRAIAHQGGHCTAHHIHGADAPRGCVTHVQDASRAQRHGVGRGMGGASAHAVRGRGNAAARNEARRAIRNDHSTNAVVQLVRHKELKPRCVNCQPARGGEARGRCSALHVARAPGRGRPGQRGSGAGLGVHGGGQQGQRHAQEEEEAPQGGWAGFWQGGRRKSRGSGR